ncbi:MAG: TSUP family transporter [Gammaproteobacteria bacterium]
MSWVPWVIVPLVSLGASTLTLFSGFGLGTLLLPVFALFFPLAVAVASTAVVHFANNIFKLGLLREHVVGRVILVFGIPALLAAFAGAGVLTLLAGQSTLAEWSLGGLQAEVTPLKLALGALIIVFGLMELVPALAAWRVSPRYLPLGGALSGFFGGLSGHQGALRAAFLSPLGLSPPQFAATQAALACLVDAARLVVYGTAFLVGGLAGPARGEAPWGLVALACLFAFGGAWIGKRLLPKVTLEGLRYLTGGLLLLVGVTLMAGIAG